MEFASTQAAIDHGLTTERTLAGFARELVKRLRLEEAVRADNAKSERAAEVRVEILRDFVGSLQRYEERTWADRPPPDEEDDWDPPSLRAFTPKDAKDLKAVVSTYPTSDFYDVGELLTSMGTGEAAVTLLSEKGVPTPVVHTRMVAPASKMAPAGDVDGAAKQQVVSLA